jgi:hypothetical protein
VSFAFNKNTDTALPGIPGTRPVYIYFKHFFTSTGYSIVEQTYHFSL